jgi:glycosyltransferase involved in cell wall biosynthesis
MRIGIVTPRLNRREGQGRVNMEIATEAIRRGHDVVVYTEDAEFLTHDPNRFQPVLSPPPAWLPTRFVRDQLLALRTLSQLRDEKSRCDVLLANGFVTWARCDVNAVHFVHSAWVRSAYHPWQLKRDLRSLYAKSYNSLNAALEKRALRRSARIVAVSDSVRRDLISIGVPADRINVITNGVDAEEFQPGPSQRERFGLPLGVPIALFAGDLRTPRKNLDTVLRALPMVPRLHLAVAGHHRGTPYPDLAQSLGVAHRVHFIGFQRDMPNLIRCADLFVFPSRYEACSLVLLEALASGVPVVTARSAGGSELIEPDVGVILEDSEDHTTLAATLRELVEDTEGRRAMARLARALAKRHTWQAMAGRYIDLLEDASAKGRMSGLGKRGLRP